MLTLGSGTLSVAPWVSGADPAALSTTYTTIYAIGEVGGDVELNIEFQEAEFRGQSNFVIARGYYGGNVTAAARSVELNFENLARFFTVAKTTVSNTAGNLAATHNVFTTEYDDKPQAMYVKFVHNRTDDPDKKVVVHLFKAFSTALNFPFMREDISTMDIDFNAIVDTTLDGGDQIVRVEIQS
jgi:hypothetical protein